MRGVGRGVRRRNRISLIRRMDDRVTRVTTREPSLSQFRACLSTSAGCAEPRHARPASSPKPELGRHAMRTASIHRVPAPVQAAETGIVLKPPRLREHRRAIAWKRPSWVENLGACVTRHLREFHGGPYRQRAPRTLFRCTRAVVTSTGTTPSENGSTIALLAVPVSRSPHVRTGFPGSTPSGTFAAYGIFRPLSPASTIPCPIPEYQISRSPSRSSKTSNRPSPAKNRTCTSRARSTP